MIKMKCITNLDIEKEKFPIFKDNLLMKNCQAYIYGDLYIVKDIDIYHFYNKLGKYLGTIIL